MSLNLVTDEWIPVRRKDGTRTTIAPWQMADAALAFFDWPRPDLNIACLELSIGLILMADPPRDTADWRTRRDPDPDRLREKLSAFAPAFDLLGDGPRFMQDLEPLERAGEPNPPDMLFIDSAGGQTAKNNADLLVKRDRYPVLDEATAAMALHTLQAHAPSGGAGNRTSMRGGGPLVTLVDPGDGLWALLWANTPDGEPMTPDDLPWMKPGRTSEKKQLVLPQDSHAAEAFFGMPRRLRLVADDAGITGVVQRPYGANYAGWEHPLTPHYRVKVGAELLPRHPKAGRFLYRNWQGVVARTADATDDTARTAGMVKKWQERSDTHADILVAGWSMDNMKPRDFVFARVPLLALSDEAAERMEAMVTAADGFARALRGALTLLLSEGEARDLAQEEFFVRTEASFQAHLAKAAKDGADWTQIAESWVRAMRDVALDIFDAVALPGLADRNIAEIETIEESRRNLTGAFYGRGKTTGQVAFAALGLPLPESKKRTQS